MKSIASINSMASISTIARRVARDTIASKHKPHGKTEILPPASSVAEPQSSPPTLPVSGVHCPSFRPFRPFDPFDLSNK